MLGRFWVYFLSYKHPFYSVERGSRLLILVLKTFCTFQSVTIHQIFTKHAFIIISYLCSVKENSNSDYSTLCIIRQIKQKQQKYLFLPSAIMVLELHVQ